MGMGSIMIYLESSGQTSVLIRLICKSDWEL